MARITGGHGKVVWLPTFDSQHNAADTDNVPIALGVPTTVNTSAGSLEIHLEESYLYTSDQPGTDASTGYKMQVWIQNVKP